MGTVGLKKHKGRMIRDSMEFPWLCAGLAPVRKSVTAAIHMRAVTCPGPLQNKAGL